MVGFLIFVSAFNSFNSLVWLPFYALHSRRWCCPRSVAQQCAGKLSLALGPSAKPPHRFGTQDKITSCTPNKVKIDILLLSLQLLTNFARFVNRAKEFACHWLCASRASRQKFSNRDCGAASLPAPHGTPHTLDDLQTGITLYENPSLPHAQIRRV